jgi:macrolide phosphotransferase
VIRSDLALAALASAAVPGMKPVSVVGVRPDRDDAAPRYQVAFVEDATGRRWVVRVPLDPAAGAELERNDALIRQLGRHLPFKVPAAAGYANVGADGRAAVFPFVEGAALNLRNLPPGPGLAAAVGRAVAAVHNIPRGLFEEMTVPVFDAASVRQRKLALLDRAAETGLVPTGLLARWEQALEAAPLWHFATTPVHGSLDGGSFIVAFTDTDAATGRVVAMTGWQHAQVADPAEDLAALVDEAPPRAFDTVADSYALARSQRPDPYIVQRARLAAEMRLLDGLAAAWTAGDETFVRLRADRLRKLDRITSTDDSLVPRTALVAMDVAPAGTAAEDGAPAVTETSPVAAPAGELTEEIEPVVDAPADGLGTDPVPAADVTEQIPRPTGTEEAAAAQGDPDHDDAAHDDAAPDETAGDEADEPSGDTAGEAPVDTAPVDDEQDERLADDPAAGEEQSPEPTEDPEETDRLQTLYDMPVEADPDRPVRDQRGRTGSG